MAGISLLRSTRLKGFGGAVLIRPMEARSPHKVLNRHGSSAALGDMTENPFLEGEVTRDVLLAPDCAGLQKSQLVFSHPSICPSFFAGTFSVLRWSWMEGRAHVASISFCVFLHRMASAGDK